MRANGYGADLELTSDSLVIHSGKVAAKLQKTATITIPLADIDSITWKNATRLVNGSARVHIAEGRVIQAYGADQPNSIGQAAFIVHWRRKDRAAFDELRIALGPLVAVANAPGAPADQAAPSTADHIAQLANLHAAGALTDEEFAAAKAKALGL